jgi:hypothetical protein
VLRAGHGARALVRPGIADEVASTIPRVLARVILTAGTGRVAVRLAARGAAGHESESEHERENVDP